MTVLIGSQATTGNTGYWISGSAIPYTGWLAYTATASGTVDTLNVNLAQGAAGKSIVLAIYNSAGTTLLGHTGILSAAVAGILSSATNVGVSVINGTSYVLAFQADSGNVWPYTNGTSTFITEDDTAQTLGTMPASLTSSTSNGVGLPSIWGSSSGGGGSPILVPRQMLLGVG